MEKFCLHKNVLLFLALILKNKFEGLAKANSRIYTLRKENKNG